jgi:virginiamycin B lyase
MTRYPTLALLLGALLALPSAASAGGSNYAITPGARPEFAGRVSEWPVPTPEFARDPAVAPDGSIYIAVMHGNKIAHFDPKTRTFEEWDLPVGARPHGLLVDRQGVVWYTGNGNGTIGRLDRTTGKVTEFKTPSGGGGPHTLVITDDGVAIWFTMQSGDKVGRLDTKTGTIKEYVSSGGPYGIALDRQGNVWFCRMGDDRLGRIDGQTGAVTEVAVPTGSRPRRMATAPDGSIWITYYGTNKVVQLDPATGRIVNEYPLPAGSRGGAYAVTVDGAGLVWVNEISTDTVGRLDPKSGELKVVKLPSKNVGIRKMVVDASGRLWYMGSHNGRLGVVE